MSNEVQSNIFKLILPVVNSNNSAPPANPVEINQNDTSIFPTDSGLDFNTMYTAFTTDGISQEEYDTYAPILQEAAQLEEGQEIDWEKLSFQAVEQVHLSDDIDTSSGEENNEQVENTESNQSTQISVSDYLQSVGNTEQSKREILDAVFGAGFSSNIDTLPSDIEDRVFSRINCSVDSEGNTTFSLTINGQDEKDRIFDTAWGFANYFSNGKMGSDISSWLPTQDRNGQSVTDAQAKIDLFNWAAENKTNDFSGVIAKKMLQTTVEENKDTGEKTTVVSIGEQGVSVQFNGEVTPDENGIYQGETTMVNPNDGTKTTMHTVLYEKDGLAVVSHYNTSDLVDGVLKEGAEPVSATVYRNDNSIIQIETNADNEVVKTTTAADGQSIAVEYDANNYANKVIVNGNETYILNGTKWYLEGNPSVEAYIQVGADGTVKINNTQDLNDRLITRTYGANGTLSEFSVDDKTFNTQNAVFADGAVMIDTDNPNVKFVVDSKNGISIQGANGIENTLVDTKTSEQNPEASSASATPEMTTETTPQAQQGVTVDTLKANGWEQTADNKYELDYNGMKVVASVLSNGEIMINNTSNGSIARYEDGKLVYLYNDMFHNYQQDKIQEENGVYTAGGKSYVVNEQCLLEEVNLAHNKALEIEDRINGVTIDTFTDANGWKQTADNKYEMDYNGMKVVASVLSNGEIMINNTSNGSIARYEDGKLVYLYNDMFHNYQQDKIQEENGVYTVGGKTYIVNEQGLLEEVKA